MSGIPFILVILIAFLSFVTGFIFWEARNRDRAYNEAVGDLRIDRSDPDGPYLFLELDKPLSSFEQEEYVVFRIKNENYISHK